MLGKDQKDNEQTDQFGEVIATINTVFMYKVNVAVAVALIFMNVPSLIVNISTKETAGLIALRAVISVVSVAYYFFSLNQYKEKIIVYEKGVRFKNLMNDKGFTVTEIINFDYEYFKAKRPVIVLHLRNDKDILISIKKYDDVSELLKFGERFALNVGAK